MTGSTKVYTAQVGAKQVNVTLIRETLYSDAYNGAAYFRKERGQYKVRCRFSEGKTVYEADGYAKTQQGVIDLFFSEMRIVAAQIEAVQPPADLFDDTQQRDEWELNNYEHDKANW